MEEIIVLIDSLVVMQRKKLLQLAEKLVPNITLDDLLQPNDYPQLENNPIFRYEEGVLEGLLTTRMALLAHFKSDFSFKRISPV